MPRQLVKGLTQIFIQFVTFSSVNIWVYGYHASFQRPDCTWWKADWSHMCKWAHSQSPVVKVDLCRQVAAFKKKKKKLKNKKKKRAAVLYKNVALCCMALFSLQVCESLSQGWSMFVSWDIKASHTDIVQDSVYLPFTSFHGYKLWVMTKVWTLWLRDR